jgi:hypothetical protein
MGRHRQLATLLSCARNVIGIVASMDHVASIAKGCIRQNQDIIASSFACDHLYAIQSVRFITFQICVVDHSYPLSNGLHGGGIRFPLPMAHLKAGLS